MTSSEKKWFTGALTLSLALATLIVVSMIAVIGVTPMGETLFGSNSAVTSMANVTMHETFSVVGGFTSATALIILLLVAIPTVFGIVYCSMHIGKAHIND